VSKLTPESWLSRAVIAAEDQRFWDHPGYDIVEVAESFALNQDKQRIARGASTLSQQAARLLVTGGERSPARKLRELLYAVEMEQTLGKARILHLYLDNAPWGEGLCGADAAALHYFGVRANELRMTQAAWLAAMLHNPDMEAKRWAERGTIDTARAQWVLLGMRGMPRPRRMEIAEDIPLLDWKPWWAQPAAAAAE
jgi:membrane peptidoglycan carboxypeptidase